MGMGMGIATWEWEGTGIKNPFPNTSTGYSPDGTIVVHGKNGMDGKRIQCSSNTSQHVSIYLQPFPVIQPVSS